MFTAEQRAKGLQTRLANKAIRDAKQSAKVPRIVQAVKPTAVHLSEVGTYPDASAFDELEKLSLPRKDLFIAQMSAPQLFDWENSPLSEAITKAAAMKVEYERVAAIIVRRQNPANHKWTCWTQEHRSLAPKTVLQQCLRHGEDGKWKFRDDGRFIVENGVRTLRPAFCCNFLCYSIYQKYRVSQKIEAGV